MQCTLHLHFCNTYMEPSKVNTTRRMTLQNISQYSCTPQNTSKPSLASFVSVIKKYLVMYSHVLT